MADNDVSYPSFQRPVTLHSIHAQKIVRRSFERTSNALYNADVVVRILTSSEEKGDQLEEVIHRMINDIEASLNEAFQGRMKQLEEKGITILPKYASPKDYNFEVRSPHVARYIQLVVLFDEYIKHIDALWLMGVMDNSEHDKDAYNWRQAILKFSSDVIDVESRAMKAARSDYYADSKSKNSDTPDQESRTSSRSKTNQKGSSNSK